MLGVSFRDQIDSYTFRQISDVRDIVVATTEREIRWARHVARLVDN